MMLTKAEARARRELAWRDELDKSKIEREAVEAGINETVALMLVKGIDVRAGSGPAQIKTALDRLREKGRVNGREYDAGRRYGRDYCTANASHLKSCLDHLDRIDNGISNGQSTAKERAQREWNHAKSEGLKGSVKLINICNAVCGRDESFWNMAKADRDQAARYEETLLVALELLVIHYGL